MRKFLLKATLILSLLTFMFSAWVITVPKKEEVVHGATAQREKAIDIYLIAGQSNAVGSTKITGGAGYSGTSYADESIYYENVWYAGEAHHTTSSNIGYNIDLWENQMVKQGMGYTTNHIGPELGMAGYFNDKYGANGDRDVAIVKTAAGGTTLLLNDTALNTTTSNSFYGNYGSWYPESLWNVQDSKGNKVNLWEGQYFHQKTGLQYRAFVKNIQEEYEHLVEQGYTDIKFKALIWMQGESDRGNPSRYEEVFPVFVSDLRNRIAELTGEEVSKMPVVAGEISKTFGSSDPSSVALNTAFNSMLNGLTGTIENMFVIPSENFYINDPNGSAILGSDQSHWNYEDMLNIGKLFGEMAYKAETITRRLYLSKEVIKTTSDPEKPSATFTTSSYFLDGEDEVTVGFNMARKFYLQDFGVLTDENGTKKSLLNMVNLEFNNKRRDYSVTLPVDDEYMVGDAMRCYAVYADAPRIIVNNSIEGSEYGYNVVVENSGTGYADAPFEFSILSKEDGRVKSLTVGGQPFDFEYGVNEYVIDNLSDYWDGENAIVIAVEYEKADEFVLENFKTEYLIGEKYDENYTVKIVDNAGNERVLSEGEYEIEGSVDVTSSGIYTLTFKRAGAQSKEIDVSVEYPTIQIRNAQLIYYVGEEYTADNLEIEVLNIDGNMRLLDSSEYEIDSSEYDSRVVGSYLIKVRAKNANYGWFTYTVDVKKEFTATLSGQKTEFYQGNEFSVGDLKVVATDANGSYNLAEKFYTIDSSEYDKDVVGTYEIKVNVQKAGVLTYEVTVSEKATLEVLDYKETYYIGESFRDTTTSKFITVNKIVGASKTKLSRGTYKVDYSAFDNTTPGIYTIVVTSKNCEDFTFDVEVKVMYDDFEVSGYKAEYYLGEDLDLSGITVTGKSTAYGDGIISSEDYTIMTDAYNKNKVGQYSIYVSVVPCAVTLKEIKVTVKNLPVLEVSGAKVDFAYGEDFATTGLVVKKNDNGTMTTLDSADYTVDSSEYNKNAVGTYTITVTAGTLSTSYTVSVNAVLSSISLSGAKVEFAYGEDFTKTGLVVKAQYNDNSEVTITDYTVDSSAYNKAVAGSYTITVSYEGQSATYNVTVQEQVSIGNKENNGGCAGKAMEILGLVSILCALAFIGKKAGL